MEKDLIGMRFFICDFILNSYLIKKVFIFDSPNFVVLCNRPYVLVFSVPVFHATYNAYKWNYV